MPTKALPNADFSVEKKKVNGITSNYVITPSGEEISFKELGKKCGVAPETFYGRLHFCETFAAFTAPKGAARKNKKNNKHVKQHFALSAFFVTLLINNIWKPVL